MIKGRKTPKETIESESKDVEHAFIKAPRGELIPISQDSGETYTTIDIEGEYEFWKNRGEKKHIALHTHPYSNKKAYFGFGALPGVKDLDSLSLRSPKVKAEVIAQRDREEGNLQGYTFIHLKKSPKNWEEQVDSFRTAIKNSKIDDSMSAKEYYKELSKVGERAGFYIRFHPARGYYFDVKTGSYEKKPSHSLEGAVASIIIGFSLLFLLIKVPFTGFIISDSVQTNFGTGLFIASSSLFALVVYFILRKAIK